MKTNVLVTALLVVFAFGGSALFWLGAREWIASFQTVRNSHVAQGIVVGFRESLYESPDKDPQLSTLSYFPLVEYTLPDDTIQRFSGQIGSPSPTYKLGEPLTVLFDPRNPSQARIKIWEELWLRPIVLIAVGMMLCGISCVAYLASQKSVDSDGDASALLISSPAPSVAMSTALRKELETLLKDGKKIEAIKKTRAEMGWDLKTSSAHIDEIESSLK